jgi:hypothetical protein
MIKTLAIAATLSLGLAGYALAQETTTGAPAGTAPVKWPRILGPLAWLEEVCSEWH